ncbi:MAG: 3-keto-5-aminohexanoate cleavage protein [Candidatus Rokubacteria bacterium]|nr:3-keto-5-aminohexanoate cleavage protein [Candidatus Rokubacteria bacterium]
MRLIHLQACLNGNRRRGEHAAVPLSRDEIVLDAARAMKNGAMSLHIHPRGADGAETLAPEACDAVVRGVRVACPDLPIGLSTGMWIERDEKRRLELIAAWTAPPDFVSVNLSEPGVPELCGLLMRRGIGIEAGVWAVADVKTLVDLGIAGRCVRVLVETQPTDAVAAVADADAIDEALDAAGFAGPRLHHGEGIATWHVLARAVARGHDIRIGLEDTLELPNGRRARDNAELVERASALLR